MYKLAPRRFMMTVLVAVLSLTVTLAVGAAKDPESSAPSSPATSAPLPATASKEPLADYATHIALTGPTSQFHDSVSARYNYAFGKDNPFLPSNATSSNGQFLSPKSFYTAQYCGHCHQEAYHQWRQTAHASSFRAPWYLKNVNMLIDEKGVQYSRHCESCHNPVALLSGDLSQGMPKKRPFEDEGVTCSTCHSIVSTDTTGTGSYVMGTPAVLVDENGAPVTGPVSDAEILAHLDRHSRAVMRPLYKTAEFCAACHKAAIPRSLDDYKFLRAISLYDEWQGASFTKQSPLPFYRKESVSSCQTCHMVREPLPSGASDPGAKDGQLASHRWPGGNTLIPAYYKYDEQSDKVANFLKNGSDDKGVLSVDIFALQKDTVATSGGSLFVAPLGLTSFSLAAGETLIADVVIQNKGIGHTLIPEQRDFYEAWVEFTVKDGAGGVLVESGFIQPDGNLDPSAHSFTSRLVNAQGELNDLHQIWHNRVLAYNNALQSGRSQLVRYRFRLPKSINGQVSLTATIRYRRFDQHFIDFAMAAKHYPQPIVDIASETRTFHIGSNPSAPPLSGENPDWMRWNNYGISLLDAQQYEASVHAFEHVASLRPDYADAYTNMAIVEIAWERYNDAKPHLAKALELLPGDPRALYYRALVERNAGQVKEAIADFEGMLAKYPRSRDGLRELGFSYFQEHNLAAARTEYERLQAVDPDDLAAHYSLAIIYRRLGEKEKSAIESAKFADQKDDPPASVYALEFLGKHPEVAAESVPWHTHDLTGDPVRHPAKIAYHYIPGAGL
jgi:tetratricopeptide (TPR) repeat protein